MKRLSEVDPTKPHGVLIPIFKTANDNCVACGKPVDDPIHQEEKP